MTLEPFTLLKGDIPIHVPARHQAIRLTHQARHMLHTTPEEVAQAMEAYINDVLGCFKEDIENEARRQLADISINGGNIVIEDHDFTPDIEPSEISRVVLHDLGTVESFWVSASRLPPTPPLKWDDDSRHLYIATLALMEIGKAINAPDGIALDHLFNAAELLGEATLRCSLIAKARAISAFTKVTISKKAQKAAHGSHAGTNKIKEFVLKAYSENHQPKSLKQAALYLIKKAHSFADENEIRVLPRLHGRF